ncbi:pilus assembly PilX family protein [Lacisediminimonas profundi]|uniref:pilus assembly PilX family protein n=1 Tax=Lacisediminimonas profundi TaxID=2603856 RepID=UPI00124AE52B|nr:hypothetical protein [Lacisediminimonas profundi]
MKLAMKLAMKRAMKLAMKQPIALACRTRLIPRTRGAALLIALVVLAGLMLATVGLVRSIDAGNLLAGNLAFKRASLNAADVGAEEAIAWLSDRTDTTVIHQDVASAGYYASSTGEWDMTGNRDGANWSRVDWDDNQCNQSYKGRSAKCIGASPATAAGNSGNEAHYVIHRMCSAAGAVDAPGNDCQAFRPASGPVSVYYRITVRVAGPRNTRSHTETVVRF